jgi:hypothetical protein
MTATKTHPTKAAKGAKAKAKAKKQEAAADATAPSTTEPQAETKARTKAKKVKEKKPSAISAAVRVLQESGKPMNCQEMIKTMADKGYWTSPGGKTPHATLYSAILREIDVKGDKARFKKTDRGQFAYNGSAE